MFNNTGFSEKDKLNIIAISLFFINFIIYICLLFYVDVVIKYDLIHRKVPVTDFRILLLPVASCIMFLSILVSYYVLDSEAEPTFSIFKTFGKLDFYLRVFVVILTFVMLKTNINVDNRMSLYLFILAAFILNFYLESNIKKRINETSVEEIVEIQSRSMIKLTEDMVIKYKEALRYGKIAFFIMVSTTLFHFILNSRLTLAIFFLIYSYIILFLLKNIYFVLYGKRKAIYEMLTKYLILICGFILIVLFNEKIIVIKIYSFSPEEISSLIGFFTFPLYYPVRQVYLGVKRSGN